MTRHDIIESLYKSQDLDDCIRKMVRQDLRADFKHEYILKMYEVPEEKLIALYDRKELRFYAVRCLINLVKLKYGVFNRLYNNTKITYDTDKFEINGYVNDFDESRLNRTLRSKTKDIFEIDEELESRLNEEQKELELIAEINRLHEVFPTDTEYPYYQALIEAVVEHGGMRGASRATGIPKSSISDSIKKVRDHLNSIYNGEEIKGIY